MSKKSKKAEEVLDTLKEKLEEKGQETTENQEDLEIVEEDLSPEELMEKENTDLKQQVGELKDKYQRVFAEQHKTQ